MRKMVLAIERIVLKSKQPRLARKAVPGQHLFPRRKCKLDFGPSKFGRHPKKAKASRAVVWMWCGEISLWNRQRRQ